MDDPEGRGSREDGPDSRERILESALRLFSRRGYEEASVAEVAADAGVSKGLVYHYFDTKRDLLEAVFLRGSERLERTLREARSGATSPPPAAVVMEVLGLVAEDLRWWRLLFRLRMRPGSGAELGREWSNTLEEALERGLRRAGSEEAAREARTLAAAVEGAAQRYVLDPDGYPLVEVAEGIVSVMLPPP